MSEMTTRQRASSILSAAKMRMLEQAGITVVSREDWYQWQLDKARLEKLEKFAEVVHAWKVERQKLWNEVGPTMDDEKEHQKKLRVLEREIITAFNALEATHGVSNQPRQEAD